MSGAVDRTPTDLSGGISAYHRYISIDVVQCVQISNFFFFFFTEHNAQTTFVGVIYNSINVKYSGSIPHLREHSVCIQLSASFQMNKQYIKKRK